MIINTMNVSDLKVTSGSLNMLIALSAASRDLVTNSLLNEPTDLFRFPTAAFIVSSQRHGAAMVSCLLVLALRRMPLRALLACSSSAPARSVVSLAD